MQAKWYLRAAEGGNVRAMYNISLCYSYGEGLSQDPVRAKRWLQLAADCGHKKALYECGIKLCAVCLYLSLLMGVPDLLIWICLFQNVWHSSALLFRNCSSGSCHALLAIMHFSL